MNIAGSFTLVNETLKLNCSGHEFDYYKPVVKQRQDYCPFGMQMAGRSFTSGDGYRYGFQGHLRDDEVSGSGNWYDFGDYGYNSRVIQRPSLDPLKSQFPGQSPYSVFNGNPMFYIDPTGMAAEDWKPEVDVDGTTSYVAEKGDDINTFVEQFDVDMDKAQEIFSKNNFKTSGNDELRNNPKT